MTTDKIVASRRNFLLTAGATVVLLPFSPVASAVPGLKRILAQASDSALGKLSQPDAFFNDEDIRLGLPLVGDLGGKLGNVAGLASGLLGGSKKSDLFGGITRKMNDVAVVAAGEAKPIFRDSIDGLSVSDAPKILKKKNGATQFLRTSSRDTLDNRLRPLVVSSMNDIGVFDEFDRISRKSSLLGKAGISHDSLSKSVTEQALDGMFAYIGSAEANFRSNPLDGVGKLFGALKG